MFGCNFLTFLQLMGLKFRTSLDWMTINWKVWLYDVILSPTWQNVQMVDKLFLMRSYNVGTKWKGLLGIVWWNWISKTFSGKKILNYTYTYVFCLQIVKSCNMQFTVQMFSILLVLWIRSIFWNSFGCPIHKSLLLLFKIRCALRFGHWTYAERKI